MKQFNYNGYIFKIGDKVDCKITRDYKSYHVKSGEILVIKENTGGDIIFYIGQNLIAGNNSYLRGTVYSYSWACKLREGKTPVHNDFPKDLKLANQISESEFEYEII